MAFIIIKAYGGKGEGREGSSRVASKRERAEKHPSPSFSLTPSSKCQRASSAKVLRREYDTCEDEKRGGFMLSRLAKCPDIRISPLGPVFKDTLYVYLRSCMHCKVLFPLSTDESPAHCPDHKRQRIRPLGKVRERQVDAYSV